MGAIFICPRKCDRIALAKDYFLKNQFEITFSGELGEYHIILCSKRSIKTNAIAINGQNGIYGCGSFFYKGLGFQNSLRQLLLDYSDKGIDFENLYGNYLIFIYEGSVRKLNMIADPAFIKNIWFDPLAKIISTSFLAIVSVSGSKYNLNKLAFVENILTGSLIPPDSYAQGVFRLDRKNFSELPASFPGLDFAKSVNNFFPAIKDKKEALIDANERLDNYFSASRKLVEEYGANIGLTGGFDSRLLLMHSRKHFKKLISHSFWRTNSQEYKNAKALASAASIDFVSFEGRPFNKPDLERMLDTSYGFFDGQVRSQNSWDEEFSCPEYIIELASGHMVNFHGCGGEQYRNADRYVRKMNFSNFIINEWLFRQGEDHFIDRNLKEDIIENIRAKIIRLTDFRPDTKIGLSEFKKVQNEIWNVSNRNTRLNLVNQQYFSFAPFTENQISQAAYRYIPWLGGSYSFEIGMMRSADPLLCKIVTNYGFSPDKNEPLVSSMAPYMVNIFPRSFIHRLNFIRRKRYNNQFAFNEFICKSHPFLQNLNTRINLKRIGMNNVLGNNLISFDTLLKKINLI